MSEVPLYPNRSLLACWHLVLFWRSWKGSILPSATSKSFSAGWQKGAVDTSQPTVSTPMRVRCLLTSRRVSLAAMSSLSACSDHQARAFGAEFPASPKLCEQTGNERSRCLRKFASDSPRGLHGVRQRQFRRTRSALRRGGLESDGFDSKSDPAQHPAHGDFTAVRKKNATHLCAGATLVPARDTGHACGHNSVRFVWRPRCGHPPTDAKVRWIRSLPDTEERGREG